MALAVESPTGSAADPVEIHEIVIVGSGFSGIGAAIKLKEMGIRDIVILEKADELGGTWRANDYPGLVVDMPSFIYSYPFEMSPEWTRVYPTGREMRDYTAHCAEKYGIRELVRCAQTVVSTEWDAERNLWLTRIEGGETIASRYFVSASGLLVHPQLPDIEGIVGRAWRAALLAGEEKITRDRLVIRQDCLCHLLQDYLHHEVEL